MIFRAIFTLLFGLSLLMTTAAPTHAASSLLPSYNQELMGITCDPTNEEDWAVWQIIFDDQDYFASQVKEYSNSGDQDQVAVESFLACALKTGNVHLWLAPYFVTFALEFLINLSGLISILMIVVGAYYYIIGGITDDKEQGKTIIQYAVLGLVVTTVAWVLVNLLLLYLTA